MLTADSGRCEGKWKKTDEIITCRTVYIFVVSMTLALNRCEIGKVLSTFPPAEEWIKKMWCIYTMEYYSAEKNNNIMKFSSKWKELENIILSEVTQTQKDKH
ncbi:hypothetical protein STEG23_016364, partial [Scotinomys teguina]